MTDKTVCTHPQTTYGLGNTYCAICGNWLSAGPPISVPTESRPTPEQLAKTLFYKEDGDILRSDARVIAYAAKVAKAYAASSSLLPVGRQPQMDDVMRYLESENFGDIATDHKDGGEFCISDAILSFVRFWESVASLPVGESTRD